MKKSELKNIKSEYTLFNNLLFNGTLPDENKVDFILHSLDYAAGYSSYDTNRKSGNNYVIAFCKLFKFSHKQIQEILIHEMIHLWQYTVKEERYARCSNDIAHDRVFRSKMTTINLILKHNGYDLTINEVCSDKLSYDNEIKCKPYYICYITYEENMQGMIKVSEKSFNKLMSEFIQYNNDTNSIKSLIAYKTSLLEFKSLKSERSMPKYFRKAEKQELFKDDKPIVII